MPCNGSADGLRYTLDMEVSLEVFEILGKEVEQILYIVPFVEQVGEFVIFLAL